MVVLAALTASLLRPAWASAPPGSLDSTVWRTATHERLQNTDVYLLEDGTSLYVAFSADSAALDDGDAVRLYLWSDKAAYTFSVDAHGVRSAYCSTGAAPEWNAQERGRPNGYTVTMQLPETLFSGTGESRWLVQFARVVPVQHVAYTWPASAGGAGNVLYASGFDGRAAGGFAAAAPSRPEPKVAAPVNVQQLWPDGSSPLGAPAVSPGAQGVAVAQTGDNMQFTGLEAKSTDGTQHDAQSLGWNSPDGRASAAAQRIASVAGAAYNVTQALSFAYDNQSNMRFSAGVAADRGTNIGDASQATYDYYDFALYGKSGALDMRWNSLGPQYGDENDGAPPPGSTGYTLSLTRAFGSVSFDANANRYRDDLGNLSDASERAAISAALSPGFTFDVSAAANAATQYATLPYAQNAAGVQYAAGNTRASVTYDQDRYQGGLARQLSVSGGFALPALGMLQFSHRQTATTGAFSSVEPEQSSSATLQHRLRDGSVTVGYQYAGGAANVTFSFEDRLPIGLLRATYYKPNSVFSAPNFSLKLVNL